METSETRKAWGNALDYCQPRLLCPAKQSAIVEAWRNRLKEPMYAKLDTQRIPEAMFWIEERNRHSWDYEKKTNNAIIAETQYTTMTTNRKQKQKHGNDHHIPFNNNFKC